ncbi:RNaseH domain-containing protein [Pseudomonas sp. PD9R]|uniref:RNaseH domain-containing protein n=1 Tax=Pseudomonas sp. PD9R TaxID=2853534 RepID=UPI001C476918|nr:RNAseH domain-containing protein [Pseudomonas sp. PD9R]
MTLSNLQGTAKHARWRPAPVPDDAAIVRVRCDANSALVTANHSKSPDAPAHVGNHIGLYRAEDDGHVHYLVSPSRHHNKESSHRNANRYIADEWLDKPWHQLGVTELVVLKSGVFGSDAVVAEGIGLLCRHAPLWDWYIRLPSPMHLGEKIAVDHPYFEAQRSSFA